MATAQTGVGGLNLNGDAARNAAVYFPRILQADPAARWAARHVRAVRDGRRRHGAHRRAARRVEGAGRHRRHAERRRGAEGRADRRRERAAEPARHQLPAHVPGLRPRGLGRAHAARRRRGRRRVQVRAGAAHGAVHRGEPVSRPEVGGVRAERRAAVGADPAERRRVHAQPVPAGRLPGHARRARPTS